MDDKEEEEEDEPVFLPRCSPRAAARRPRKSSSTGGALDDMLDSKLEYVRRPARGRSSGVAMGNGPAELLLRSIGSARAKARTVYI